MDRLKSSIGPTTFWMTAICLGLSIAFLAGYGISQRGKGTGITAASNAAPSVSGAEPKGGASSTIETRIPMLVVLDADQNQEGRVVDVSLTLTRDRNSAAPFQIAFLEDTPGGHGTQLRSSVWMAAMVAALQRDTDLAGCRLTASIPGSVDGPSAGGALCLAILGLLDGRPFPQDLAVTGAILPDGSIGQVGGLSLKIAAAGTRGVRRVIVPEHLRFEAPQGNAGVVDLKSAADRARVEFLPAAAMPDAYRIAYGDAPIRPPPRSSGRVNPGPDLDAYLAARAVAMLTDTWKTWQTVNSVADSLQQNEQYRQGTVRLVEQAGEALEAGFVLAGHSNARALQSSVEGRKRWQPLMQSVAEMDASAGMRRLDSELAAALQPFNDPAALAEAWIVQTNRSPIATQYFVDLETLCATSLLVTTAGETSQNRNDGSPADGREQPSGATAAKDPETIRRVKEFQLLLAVTGQVELEAASRDLAEIGRRLPIRSLPPGRADRVERLFHSALSAIDQTLSSNVVDPLAESLQLSPADAARRLVQEDPLVLYYVATVQTTERMHQRLEQLRARGESNDLLAAATAQLCATQVAEASGILVQWTELNAAGNEDGTTRFGRKATLSRLLWAARENAIRNIQECAARGIPCPRAIEFLQDADLTRDDRDTDPIESLISYWKAGLQAQALRQLFGADEGR